MSSRRSSYRLGPYLVSQAAFMVGNYKGGRMDTTRARFFGDPADGLVRTTWPGHEDTDRLIDDAIAQLRKEKQRASF